MKPALRAALGGGEVSAGVCVTMGNLNELISVGLCPIFGGARLRFYVGLYAVQLGHPGRYLHKAYRIPLDVAITVVVTPRTFAICSTFVKFEGLRSPLSQFWMNDRYDQSAFSILLRVCDGEHPTVSR